MGIFPFERTRLKRSIASRRAESLHPKGLFRRMGPILESLARSPPSAGNGVNDGTQKPSKAASPKQSGETANSRRTLAAKEA